MGNTESNTKSNILGGPDAKFGISPNDIIEAFRLAKNYGVKNFGIHMMTGSCVLDNNYWEKSVKLLIDNIIHIEQVLEINIDYINIGGGIGIPYNPEEKVVDINYLVNTIDNCFKLKNKTVKNLYMENGRYITGPYGWLLAKCNCVKHSFGATYYGLDACMANLMRPGMYGSYHHIDVYKRYSEFNYVNVVGTLCENHDWFAKNRYLPKANVDDIFIIYDTGAHSHSMGFQYNGKLRAPEILYTCDKNYKLIRRRETFDDYINNIN